MRALLMGGQACVLYGAAEFKDAAYWRPLKAEIERLRHSRLRAEAG